MKNEIDWSSRPLPFEDQRLLDAYWLAGVAIDELAYTPQFEKLCKDFYATPEITDGQRYTALKRLMTLKKMGRLPRVGTIGYR